MESVKARAIIAGTSARVAHFGGPGGHRTAAAPNSASPAAASGIVDVHLLASARLSGAQVWTLDRRLHQAARRLKVRYPARTG
jgi:predicted nucleic acid-binding protein